MLSTNRSKFQNLLEAVDFLRSDKVVLETIQDPPLATAMMLTNDMAHYLYFLGIADGIITDQEYTFLKKFWKLHKEYRPYIKNAIKSIREDETLNDFLNDIPFSFKFLIQTDNKTGGQLSMSLYEIYRDLGEEFILADYADDIEQSVLNRYLGNFLEYIQNNLLDLSDDYNII